MSNIDNTILEKPDCHNSLSDSSTIPIENNNIPI